MIVPAHVRIALASLKSTRIRTSLTTLGIVIGVTSITLVLALGEGAKNSINQQINQLNQDIVVIKPGREDQQSAFSSYNPFAISPTTTLTERDYNSIVDSQPHSAVAPLMFINGTVKNTKETAEAVPVLATSPELVDVLQLKVHSGQFLDLSTSRDTVVLGEQLAIELLGTDQARGQEVIIKGRPHTVIGVLSKTTKPINLAGVNLDRSAYISFSAGKSFNQGVAQIQQIFVKVASGEHSAPVAASIDKLLYSNHANERDYTVLEGRHAGNGANSFYNTIVIITTSVAIIALIVGGIGIMNVMLVSVTERTREIGIRKALGATDGQILLQFLIEALVMTVSGGVIGLVLAYLIAFIIATFFSFQPALTWPIVIAALSLALVTGVLFGIFPALKASRKDPIAALRQYQ